MAVAAPARFRLVADKLSAVSYDLLSHSRHKAGNRSTKVGHEIRKVR